MKNILLFASGGGSNVRAILTYFKDHASYHFPLVVTNRTDAGVIKIAQEFGLDVLLVDKDIFESAVLLDTLDLYKPDLLVLAGFLWKIPEYMVEAYNNKIVNIHPALLPAYGGKGMYGHFVHEAVIAAKEKESGMTIHMVNENYDEGIVLLQKKVSITKSDNAITLAAKVLALEHEWYPKVIESLLINLK
ncbi:MAG: phosphoribosylglycinamide formyltransferase [Chitinophagaceae bacterium]|nr:phosphoribosylglycinamide formyltransferase [Chitinophagaceae bacterium]